jgi:hypothetical protein
MKFCIALSVLSVAADKVSTHGTLLVAGRTEDSSLEWAAGPSAVGTVYPTFPVDSCHYTGCEV